MNNRTENGQVLAGTEVVAADAIARMAGVDLKSVSKVLLAIEALRVATGRETPELCNVDAVPTSAMSCARFARSVEFVEGVVHALQKSKPGLSLLDQLAVHRRFGKQRRNVIRSTHTALGAPLALVG
jgi:hypothetical protein